ncbi:hypothetical protein [Comamonas sp. 4034]|uniref:hypothetical protein n=1 Tax=Comamonas sp. 4034 TaxID=3156455 RepID=UPI003D231F8F
METLKRSNLRADLRRRGDVVESETQISLQAAVSKINGVIGVVVGEAVALACDPYPTRPSNNTIALVHLDRIPSTKPRSHGVRKRLNHAFDLKRVVIGVSDDRRNVVVNLFTCSKATSHEQCSLKVIYAGLFLIGDDSRLKNFPNMERFCPTDGVRKADICDRQLLAICRHPNLKCTALLHKSVWD